jgi:hypothetical protein
MRRTATRLGSLAVCLALLFSVSSAHAQDPQDLESLDELSAALQVMGDRYADLYVQPVTDAMGSGMNAGLFRTADVSGGILPGVDLYLGLSVSGALMASSDKAFSANFREEIEGPLGETTYTLRVEGDTESLPTAFGNTAPPKSRLVIESDGEKLGEARLPPGLVDTPVAPLLVPQAGIGSLFGTDVQVRYLPETRIYEYGTVGLFGIAVRHSISQYIPLSPLELSVQGAYNEMSLGTSTISTGTGEVSDVLDASGWAVNLQASKGLPVLPVTFYGGLQYETFDVEYSYVFDPSSTEGGAFAPGPVSLTLDQSAANQFRGIAGVSITLAIVRLNVDYALAANDAVTFGLGVKL